MEITKEKYFPNPRETANPLSVLMFGYTFPMFKKGYSKNLDADDLYNPLKKDKSKFLGDKLEQNWNCQVAIAKKTNSKPSLLRALVKTFWLEYFYLGLLAASNELVLKILQPMLLGGLLDYFNPSFNDTREKALIYGGLMLLASVLSMLISNQYMLGAFHGGMRIRAACCALIYRKALKLSKTALGDTASGKIVNLLSNDVSRFDVVSLLLHQMWLGPCYAIIVMVLLYRDAGYAGIIGIVAVFTTVLLQAYTGKLSAKYREQTAIKTDERIRLIDEVLSGIQVIKMYAWEKPFQKIIKLARKKEIQIITKSSYVRATFMAFTLFTTRLALFCSLLTLVLAGEPITASRVYVFSSYFNLLSMNMGAMFVRGISEIAEVSVAIKRIQSFLMNEEYDPAKIPSFMNGNIKSVDEIKDIITLKNLTVKWNLSYTDNALENINMNISDGQLVGIIGPVGSGKSSLLQTILGELDIVHGEMSIRGQISYASQEPWVFATTVRQNILFGEVYDKKRYQEVIQACALETDFKQFENGDLTMVGDRGASLSGGQKARINLARAVYREADIYLFDDPLSAVDIHVSKHLFDKCINGYLANRTRILVTHQVHYLKDADHLIILNNGRVEDEGNFNLLTSSENVYAKLLTADTETTDREKQKIDKTKLSRQLSQRERVEDEGTFNLLTSSEDVYAELLAADTETADTEKDKINKSKFSRQITERHRKGSMVSLLSDISVTDALLTDDVNLKEEEEEEENEKEEEIQIKNLQEESSKGKVYGSLLYQYISAGTGVCVAMIIAFLFIATQLGVSSIDYWISYWVNIEEYRNQIVNGSTEQAGTFSVKLVNLSTEICLYIYGGILFILFSLAMIRSFAYYKVCMLSSKRLHGATYDSVISATMRFFDTNPGGRILNRFSKDMGSIDEILPKVIMDCGQMLLSMVGALLLIIVVNPYFLILMAILSVIFGLMRRVYLKSSKNINRLEGIMRSPVFTHLKATIEGLTTIRAFGAESTLMDEFDNHQDYHSSAWYQCLVSNSAFGFYLDAICSAFLGFLSFTFILFSENLGMRGGEVGLAISQATALTGFLQWAVRLSADVANQLMSVERVLEYKTLPKEIEPKVPKVPPKEWPQKGEIIFKDACLRYFEGGPLVLKHLNLTIKPKEKVGVVGRTGAGKSSLIQALFRLAPIEGGIQIDGIDTKDISLKSLRLKISIIPQDPVLFSGTLRYNLDPFDEYSDEALYKAIGDVELKDPANVNNRLENVVKDRGSNYSVGQKQLICLARAILKQNRVLMLDEATANVDPQTDALIQKTIRKKFVDCSVITVAHRLNTIMDSDKVLVMDAGQVAEYDHPHLLLQNTNGVFYKMVAETGQATAEELRKIASDSHQKYFALPK